MDVYQFYGIAMVTIGLNNCALHNGMFLTDFFAIALGERFFG